jgi:hypothetical protein
MIKLQTRNILGIVNHMPVRILICFSAHTNFIGFRMIY